MKLYSDKYAPNPRRVRMFLAEKGITDIEIVEVEIAKNETQSAEFLAKNPLGWLPVLELDDGTFLPESLAICRYFDDLRPDPPLFGRDSKERVAIERWTRHIEFELLVPISMVFRNTHSFWADRLEQVPEFGEVSRKHVHQRLGWLDEHMADREFIATDALSVADIAALAAIDFGRISKIRLGDEHPNLQRWHAAMSARPSAKA